MRRRWLVPLLFLALMGVSLSPAMAQAQGVKDGIQSKKARFAAAKKNFRQGRKFLSEKRYGEAVVAFRKAYEITSDGLVMGQVALAYEKAGDYRGALKAYEVYRDALPKRKQRGARIKIRKCKHMIKRGKSKRLAIPEEQKPAPLVPGNKAPKPVLANTKGQNTKAAAPKGAVKAVTPTKADQGQAGAASAGTKTHEGKVAKGATVAKAGKGQASTDNGESQGTVPATLMAESTEGKRFYTWIAAGGAAALALSGLVVGLNAQSKFDELDESCAPTCSPDQVDSVNTRALVADVLLGVAAGAAVTAGVLYFLEGRWNHQEKASAGSRHRLLGRRVIVTPVAGRGTVGLSADITF